MADLRAEVGVLARTADILQNQYNEVKQTIVSFFRSDFVLSKVYLADVSSDQIILLPRAKLKLKLFAFSEHPHREEKVDSNLEDYQCAHARFYKYSARNNDSICSSVLDGKRTWYSWLH